MSKQPVNTDPSAPTVARHGADSPTIADSPTATNSAPTTYIARTAEQYRLTQSQIRILQEAETDLAMWGMPPLHTQFKPDISPKLKGKARGRDFMGQLATHMHELRKTPADYANFTPKPTATSKGRGTQEAPAATILSLCPVAGEETRCCNLQTLDVVTQCAFGCTYCAIRSFYRNDHVLFPVNLQAQLAALELDPAKTYHIGTGQSSDSLLWGNHGGLLTNLFDFAHANPNVILELKTKAAGTPITEALALKPPKNVLFTWSLNPQVIIDNEEHLTASLAERLQAAQQVAEAGYLVGFHLHPMVWYKGWQDDYANMADQIMQRFQPEQVVMISLGTLTFTKAVLKQLREEGVRTLTTKIPFAPAGNKLSYPLAVKEEMFSHVYKSFDDSASGGKWDDGERGGGKLSEGEIHGDNTGGCTGYSDTHGLASLRSPQAATQSPWHSNVFFYLCMEDPALWQPVFGHAYADNKAFEEAMLSHYQKKIASISRI